jgi:sporulation protein YlmC with PRC-barrel domain
MVISAARLYARKVRAEDGRLLGRVHEIHAEGGEVRYLTVGAGGWLQRLTASHRGQRIEWSAVLRIEDAALVVGEKPARRRPARKTRRA